MDLSQELLYSTVRLEVETDRGTSVGTAFFYLAAQTGDDGVPVLITNKHVVRGGTQAKFSAHLATPDDVPSGTSCAVSMGLESLVLHPDPNVDLCALPIGPIMAEAARRGSPLFFRQIGKELIASEAETASMRAIEDVLMIGYPNGLWDQANNRPIVRRGITATAPSINFNGRPEFMIDAACFPGSSGSPVFLYERSAIQPKPNVLIGRRFHFLGVLYAGPIFDSAGAFRVAPIPTTHEEARSNGTMMHLGFVIHARALGAIDDVVRSRLPSRS